MKHYRISKVEYKGIVGDKWLLRLEKAAFGWNYYGSETEDVYGYEITGTTSGVRGRTTHNIIEWMQFRRITPYSSNILFHLFEQLSKMWSFIRRLILVIGVPIFGIIVLAVAVDGIACSGEMGLSDEGLSLIGSILLLYLLVIILPTFIFICIGWLFRKFLGVDKKLKESLKANGYDDDLTNCG